MAIQFRDAAAGVNAYSGATLTIPDTVQPGDLLLVVVDINNQACTLNTPDGWTQLATSEGSNTGGSQFAALFTRTATDVDADSDVTFGVTPAGSTKSANLAAYYTDTAGAELVVGVSSWRGETTDTTLHATPIINVAQLPATLITAIGKKGSTVTTLTPPTGGYTMRGTPSINGGTSNNATALADRPATVIGNTAGSSWTVNVSNKAATTFMASLYETQPPPPPKVALRRWDGTGWVLAGG